MKEVNVYNLDENLVAVKKYTELDDVLSYYEFFKKYKKEF